MTEKGLRGFKLAGAGGLGVILLLVILGTMAVVSALQEDNIVANPGFENPEPADWESKDAGSPGFWSYSWSSSPVHGGDHSVGIEVNLSTYNGWWQSIPPAAITATRPYTFSGWIRSEAVEDQAFLTLVFLDSDGREILTTDSGVVSGSTDWMQVRSLRSVVAPIDAVSAHVRCQLIGRGTAWYDDVFLGMEPGEFAHLELEKSAVPSTVEAGQMLTYTLRYSNTGAAVAENVIVVDTLPPGVTAIYLNPTVDVQPDAYTLVWNVGDVDEGGTPGTITIAVAVSDVIADGQSLVNSATIAGEMVPLATSRITTVVTASSGSLFHYLPFVAAYGPSNTVINGGFEDGWNGWAYGGVLSQSVTSANPHSGGSSALLGSPDYLCNYAPVGSAWIEQTFLVPSTGSPKLSFSYNVWTHDRNHDLSNSYDLFEVKINGVQVFADMNTTEPYGCQDPATVLGWNDQPIDLSAYKGTPITIRFQNWNRPDRKYNTWTFVDDVRVDP